MSSACDGSNELHFNRDRYSSRDRAADAGGGVAVGVAGSEGVDVVKAVVAVGMSGGSVERDKTGVAVGVCVGIGVEEVKAEIVIGGSAGAEAGVDRIGVGVATSPRLQLITSDRTVRPTANNGSEPSAFRMFLGSYTDIPIWWHAGGWP